MILLIDDDEDFRTALSDNLREDGHTVQEYDDLLAVPAFDDLGGYDLVLVDYQLPHRNGVSFADAFHDAHPGVPIVLITASCSEFLEGQLARRPFIQLLQKPVAYAQVDALIHRVTTTR